MHRLFFTSSIAILTIIASCQPADQRSETLLFRSLDSLFREVTDFSGVVMIAKNGKPVYHKGFGYTNYNAQTPLDTTAVFELASVSKQFTAMIIMMLKEQRLLDYDDPVANYIPGLPYSGITIRHLLNHTSGLPDYQAVMDEHWDKSSVAGNEDNIAYLIRYHPKALFEPGEKYGYSNTGYMLLASVAEQVAQKDFVKLCREKIFAPLSMTQTDIRTSAEKTQLPNMAWGHILVPEKSKYIHADSFPAFNYSIWLGNRKGPGRISGSSTDLLKWDQALYTERLIKHETLRQAFTPAQLNDGKSSGYGFGWIVAEHPGLGRKIFHTGDNPGYKSIIIRYIDTRQTLILLSNNAHEKFQDIVVGIENAL